MAFPLVHMTLWDNGFLLIIVWQNKPNKVKRDTLIADYEDGGLRMLDISSFLKAQKAMWVKRLTSTDNASWKAIPNFYLKWLLGPDTWKCNMSCDKKQKNFSDFYWQILINWNEVRKINNKIDNVFDIRRQCLWFNQDIKINKKEVRWDSWHNNGINQIHDIVNIEGKFLAPKEIEEIYNVKCDFLKYNQLKDAISLKWRSKLKTIKVTKEAISFQEQPHLRIGKIDKPISLITNKDIYWSFVKNKQVKPIIIEKMTRDLAVKEDQWKEIFTIPRVIQDTKIRAFQYKVLYKLIPCNLYLKKIKKSDTDRCNHCNKVDDLLHYFYECVETRVFWQTFQNWWQQMSNDNVKITLQQVIVGIIDKYDKKLTLNSCILLAKWFVYKCKLSQSQLFFYKFLCDIKYNLIIERIIAMKYNTLIKYNQKWQMIEDFLA
jgi:hypothetical protein